MLFPEEQAAGVTLRPPPPARDFCQRCGLGRDPKALSTVTVTRDDGHKVKIKACPRCVTALAAGGAK